MQLKVSKKLKKIRLNLTLIFEIILPFLFFEFFVYGKDIKGISKIDHTSFLIFAISWIFLSYLRQCGLYLMPKVQTPCNFLSIFNCDAK